MGTRTAKMDPETERSLLIRWTRDRDVAARDRLVASQQSLVVAIANRHGRSAQAVADLVQEGNLGLLHALDRFDLDRGVRLSTYATWWVRAFMLRFIERNRGLIRGTTTANRTRLFYQLERTRQRLIAAGDDVTRQTIADAMGVSVDDVAAMEALRVPTTSLDAPLPGRDGGSISRIDAVADQTPGPEE
nr:sigma-70 family RNA polymerase sigma factor [Deltaproteobacteria bacterium]